MQVVGNFNKISEKLKAEIPTLKPNESVTFEVLYGIPNPDPDANEKMKNPKLYGKKQIVTKQRIYDPYLEDSKGKEVGGYVDIGVVDGWEGDKPSRFRLFVPGFGTHQFMGKFSLVGGRVDDMELYEFLWLSNEREGNKHRDISVTPMYRIVDEKKQTTSILNKVDILRDALNKAAAITEEKAIEVWAALNQPSTKDFSILKGLISEYAKQLPDAFLLAYNDEKSAMKAEIKKALDLGVLKYDEATKELTQGKNKLTVVEKTSSFLDDIAAWMTNSTNGESVMGLVKKGIAKETSKQLEIA
jgi:hypothetical protein